VAEIITSRIAAVIGEFEPAPAFARKPVRAVLPRECALRDHVQVLELLQEIVFEA